MKCTFSLFTSLSLCPPTSQKEDMTSLCPVMSFLFDFSQPTLLPCPVTMVIRGSVVNTGRGDVFQGSNSLIVGKEEQERLKLCLSLALFE